MSGLVALLTPRSQRATLGREALAYLRHTPAQHLVEVEEAGAWLGAVGKPGSCWAARAGEPGTGAAAVVCGNLVGEQSLTRELGLEASDPATLLLSVFERWGTQGLARLDGAYAFVLVRHERTERRVLAGGDPCGILRITAIDLGGDTMVATEGKAFLAHPSFRASLDLQAAAQLLTLGYVLDGRSLFSGAVAAPLGTVFEIRDRRTRPLRLWDPRDDLSTQRGKAYLESLAQTIVTLGPSVFGANNRLGTRGDGMPAADGGAAQVVLPLTAGLDSRLLAAAAPAGTRPDALTFGTGRDPDSLLGQRIAAARGFPHVVLPLDQDYLARCAGATVWLSEGRLNPAANLSGFLMADFADRQAFVSGVGGEIGRHPWKSHLLWPDQGLLEADDAGFERRLRGYLRECPLDLATTHALAGPLLQHAMSEIDGELTRVLAETRGLHPVDRVDAYLLSQRIREFTTPGLALSELYLDVRAPYLTRSWLRAVLGGAPSERCDDLVRVHLISMLDRRVARIPWTLTHLSLPASAPLLAGLRVASRAAYHALPHRHAAPTGLDRGSAHGGALGRLKGLVYAHGERREEWLRRGQSTFIEDTVLSASLADHGLLDPAAVRRLLAAQFGGADCALAIGQLVNLELWQRLFVLRDAALVGAVREQVARAVQADPSPGRLHSLGDGKRTASA
jgi:hypothetical protein